MTNYFKKNNSLLSFYTPEQTTEFIEKIIDTADRYLNKPTFNLTELKKMIDGVYDEMIYEQEYLDSISEDDDALDDFLNAQI